jgi:hypothetical protein
MRTEMLALVLAACRGAAGSPDGAAGSDVDAARPHATCDFADGVCAECSVRAEPLILTSDLTAEVCGREPKCCTTAWDEHCAAMAQNTLGNGPCADTVTFGGPGGIAWARVDGDGFTGGTVALDDDVTSLAWSGRLLAVTGPCGWRIYHADGWQDGAPVLTLLASGGACGFDGHRARWTDLDFDDDIDAMFAGDGGVVWARQDDATFVDAGALIPPADGSVLDVAAARLDGDELLDLAVLFSDGRTTFYVQAGGSSFYTYSTLVEAALSPTTLALCNVDDHGGAELLVAGAGGVDAQSINPGFVVPTFGNGGIPGVGPARDVACSPDGAVFVETDNRLVLFAHGAVTWDSSALGSFDGDALAVSSLTGFDIVVARTDAGFDMVEDLVNRIPGIDPDPGAATTSVALTHLGGP